MCTSCACGTDSAATVQVDQGDAKTYSVNGMTCGHCVSSVSEEIGAIGGVTGVSVDLTSGAVAVSGSGFSDEEIRAAVERAGYTLVSRP